VLVPEILIGQFAFESPFEDGLAQALAPSNPAFYASHAIVGD